MREGAAWFNISNESVVRRWVNVYKDTGPEGLQNLKRGRARQVNKKDSAPPSTGQDLGSLSPEELRAELRYLRAENAYLKKLKALVQQKKNEKNPEQSVN